MRKESNSGTSRRGPTAEARSKAAAAKHQKKAKQLESLSQALSTMELQLISHAVAPEALTHETVWRRCGVSKATYWRYLREVPELRIRAERVTGAIKKENEKEYRNESGKDVQALKDGPAEKLQHAEQENGRLMTINVVLQKQVAACKSLIQLMASDLAATRRGIKAKDALLEAERNTRATLAGKLSELVIYCKQANIILPGNLSDLMIRPRAKGNRKAEAVAEGSS